ncbi:hypothetical protein AVEN_65165-1 [Araneus ventricosus]|uniref:Uncharacterized protein n=1 Tax=Araneus ventricosus TaxID=182803 RepID=A0A4Y2AHY0_ARAVE|nr:hypothetical protein AVEN_65165-1 [Araneus ventricosus]
MTRTTPELAPPPLSKLPHHINGRVFGSDRFECAPPAYAAVLRWNRISNLEPSDPETLQPGHRGPVLNRVEAFICIHFNDQYKIICEGLYMNIIWPDLIEYFVGYEVPQGRATARTLRAALFLILCGPTLWGQ